MTYKSLQTTFERELLYQLITSLREKKMSVFEAKRTARAFLPLLKVATVEEFSDKLCKLSYGSKVMMEAFITSMKLYEKELIDVRLAEVRTQLKGGETYYGNN